MDTAMGTRTVTRMAVNRYTARCSGVCLQAAWLTKLLLGMYVEGLHSTMEYTLQQHPRHRSANVN